MKPDAWFDENLPFDVVLGNWRCDCGHVNYRNWRGNVPSEIRVRCPLCGSQAIIALEPS